MLNINEVKTGSEFITLSDLKVSDFASTHDSKFFADSDPSTQESRLRKRQMLVDGALPDLVYCLFPTKLGLKGYTFLTPMDTVSN